MHCRCLLLPVDEEGTLLDVPPVLCTHPQVPDSPYCAPCVERHRFPSLFPGLAWTRVATDTRPDEERVADLRARATKDTADA